MWSPWPGSACGSPTPSRSARCAPTRITAGGAWLARWSPPSPPARSPRAGGRSCTYGSRTRPRYGCTKGSASGSGPRCDPASSYGAATERSGRDGVTEPQPDRGLRVTGPAPPAAARRHRLELVGERHLRGVRRAVVHVRELVRIVGQVVELVVAVDVLHVRVRGGTEAVVLGDVLDVLDAVDASVPAAEAAVRRVPPAPAVRAGGVGLVVVGRLELQARRARGGPELGPVFDQVRASYRRRRPAVELVGEGPPVDERGWDHAGETRERRREVDVAHQPVV